MPLTSGLVALMFGTRHAGMLFGFVFLSHQVGAFVGVWLGGAIYEATGALRRDVVDLDRARPRRGDRAPADPRAARPALGAGPGMSLLAASSPSASWSPRSPLAGAYWQAERTAAFERQDGTGETLRLVCPLH